MNKRFFTLMFHGVVDQLPEYALYPASYDCQLRKHDFEKAIRYCTAHYKILRQEDLPAYYDGTAKEDGVLISFDDALQNVFTNALPILEKYKAPATVFITSDWTNGGVTPSVFAIEYALFRNLPATITVVKDDFYFNATIRSKKEIAPALDHLWRTLFDAKLAPLLLKDENIEINHKGLGHFRKDDANDCWKPASWQTLANAGKTGLIEAGAHGRTHSPFTWLDKESLNSELFENKEQIKKHLGIAVNTCSYPHGLRDTATKEIMRHHFTYAFANTAVDGFDVNEKMNLPRYNVPYQRPNDISLIIKNARLGNIARRIGSISKLY